MIISKPQTGTITSFALFILITIVVVTMNAMILVREAQPAWYNYAVVAVLIPIGVIVFYKIFIRYKILRLGNNQIQIDFPVIRQQKKYTLEEINQWAEVVVKTGKNSTYKELEILFSDKRKINVGHREHTEYVRMVQYLTQKAPKKKSAARSE